MIRFASELNNVTSSYACSSTADGQVIRDKWGGGILHESPTKRPYLLIASPQLESYRTRYYHKQEIQFHKPEIFQIPWKDSVHALF